MPDQAFILLSEILTLFDRRLHSSGPLVDITLISTKSVLSMPTPPAPVSVSIDAEQRKRRRDGENAFIVVALFSLTYGVEQKNLAKFSDTSSVRAERLCIGSPRLVGGRKAGNSDMLEIFGTTL